MLRQFVSTEPVYVDSSSDIAQEDTHTPTYAAQGKFEGPGAHRTSIYNVYITVRDEFQQPFGEIGHCEFVRRDDGSVIYGWRWKHWQIQNAFEEKFGTVQASTLYALGKTQALADGFSQRELQDVDREMTRDELERADTIPFENP